MAPPRQLLIAQILAGIVVVVAIGIRAADLASGSFPFGSAWLPPLTAAAAVLASAVLRRRAPAAAWLAAVGAAALAGIEVVGSVRARQATPDLTAWPFEAALAFGVLVLAAGIAAAYGLRASGTGRALGMWRLAVVGTLAVVVLGTTLAVFDALNTVPIQPHVDLAVVDLGPLRTIGRIATALIAIATVGGLWGDLASPTRRAWAGAGGATGFPRALADELLPTSAAMRRRGVEDERARLAAELHARVLPDLRRAAAAAEATGSASDPLAVGLRHAVEDVEELMHGRQSVVLEEYGLVAALEWLAERTQQRGTLLVDLELDGATVGDPSSVSKPIARAAFRVAQLAIDNVVRHAAATRIVLRLFVDPTRVELAIEDDGTGIEANRAGRSGRGLLDMRAAAAEIGAVLRVEPRAPGTTVDFVIERVRDPISGPATGAPNPEAAPGR
jgi:signal transduction histidine kinase